MYFSKVLFRVQLWANQENDLTNLPKFQELQCLPTYLPSLIIVSIKFTQVIAMKNMFVFWASSHLIQKESKSLYHLKVYHFKCSHQCETIIGNLCQNQLFSNNVIFDKITQYSLNFISPLCKVLLYMVMGNAYQTTALGGQHVSE